MARRAQKVQQSALPREERPGVLNIRRVPGHLMVKLKVAASQKRIPLREHVIQVLEIHGGHQ